MTTQPCPIPLVCPSCKGPLESDPDRWRCAACGAVYGYAGGFPDLIVGERFEDASDETLLRYEEHSNAHLAENYWIPLFRRLWPGLDRPRILSCGCGTGMDVDLLAGAGFDIVGIDCGNRTQVWPRRAHPERLLLANGKNLPFRDQTFDGAFCGCVFPHVGVLGDSNRVGPHFKAERLSLAREMARVLKPGGKIVVASPNRWFPFDIFHGRRPGSYKPRWNWPGNPFLLSLADYRDLFRQAGCGAAETLPINRYWGFVRSQNSLKGLLLGLPVRFVFWLVSLNALRCLRASPINPWLIVLITK